MSRRILKKRKVLAIDYASHYNNSNVRTLIFHPHYLKEFNGRWYLLGHAEGEARRLLFGRNDTKALALFNV